MELPNNQQLLIKTIPLKELKAGDVFVWCSGMTGECELHTFHSDAGYGAKTFTGYDEKDGSSTIVNYSGIRGVLNVEEQ